MTTKSPVRAPRATELFAGAEAPALEAEGPLVLMRTEMEAAKPSTLRLVVQGD